jgi:hypothetical protein
VELEVELLAVDVMGSVVLLPRANKVGVVKLPMDSVDMIVYLYSLYRQF